MKTNNQTRLNTLVTRRDTLIKFSDLGIGLIKRADSCDLVTLDVSGQPRWYLATIDTKTNTIELHDGHPILFCTLPENELS